RARAVARLESRQLRMRQLPALHAHAAELGAAVQGRDVLARIEQSVGIERALHALEALDLRGGELYAHLVDLLHAHAVLASDGAADLDAFLEHLAREALGAVELVGVVRVVENQRVQVAVAGVEHVRAAQAVFLLHPRDEFQDLAELLSRDRAVHAVVVGRDAADRGERRLAPRPETLPLGLRARDAYRGRAGALEQRAHARDALLDLLASAV